MSNPIAILIRPSRSALLCFALSVAAVVFVQLASFDIPTDRDEASDAGEVSRVELVR